MKGLAHVAGVFPGGFRCPSTAADGRTETLFNGETIMAAKKKQSVRNDRLGSDAGERVKEKKSPKVAFYHLCNCCGAKWFSIHYSFQCLRCGYDQLYRTVERVPWHDDST